MFQAHGWQIYINLQFISPFKTKSGIREYPRVPS
jgi:hypothetical protein